MNYYLSAFKKYAVFGGRASRAEYWMFALFNFIVVVALEIGFVATHYNIAWLVAIAVYGLVTFLPGLGLLVRRLHDTGRSGGWFWIGLVPFIGGIWLLVLLATAGTLGPNQYGHNPLAVRA